MISSCASQPNMNLGVWMKLPLFGKKANYHGLLEKAVREAQTGRQLALYDRETGLYAPWFFGLRCPEECYRAVRYNRPLTLLLIEVRAEGDDLYAAVGEVVNLLKAGRRSDVASHLGGGRFAVLLPETDAEGAEILASRLQGFAPIIATGTSSPPYDGGNQEQLVAAATLRLREAEDLAA